MLELQASSSPPPPTTAALAPAARSRPRRVAPADATPDPLPLPGGSIPRAPAPPPGLSWSLMCNRSPFEVAPWARDRV